jgi:hypothetical protein
MSLHTIQNVLSLLYLSVSLSLTYDKAHHQQVQLSPCDALYVMFSFLEFI